MRDMCRCVGALQTHTNVRSDTRGNGHPLELHATDTCSGGMCTSPAGTYTQETHVLKDAQDTVFPIVLN